MSMQQLIAALATLGGLRTPGAVEAALREAAPERDFRQLIDMVRAAISALINVGRSPNDRTYIGLEAIYADRAVVEFGGKKFQYAYQVKNVNGNDQVVLGAPIEVVEQYVPTSSPVSAAGNKAVSAAATAAATEGAAMVEALASGLNVFREAADGSIAVTLIRAGASGNANFYPDAALREAASLFEGVRVFVKSDEQHLSGGGKDVRSLIGGIYGVRFVEGKTPDSGALVGTFKPLDPNDQVVTKMTEAVKRGMQDLMGLSIDAVARTKQRREGTQVLREAVKFTKVHSVDLIVQPGAGGGLDRLTEAAASSHSTPTSPIQPEGNTMPLWKQRLLEAIQAKDAARHAAINPATIGDDELVRLAEAMGVSIVPTASTAPAVNSIQTQRVAEAQGDATPVTRAELQMFSLRQTAASRIALSKLPQPAKDRLTAQFQATERFTEAEVDAAIKSEGEYLARFTESGAVRVPALGAGSIQVGDRSIQMADMLDAFFDPAHKNHRDIYSFRECYVEITGDRRVTGQMANMDMGRLRESLGSFVEAVDSTTFGNALGNSITRRMQAVYAGMTDLQAWRRVAISTPVSDFRSQERVRIGGYGNLPVVAQSAGYAALSSPGDQKATYTVAKRGGTESVTLEAIRNDDVQAIRRVPSELALAAANTLYEFVFDFFATNPVIYDSVALYHASHSNLFVGALSSTEFASHRLAMLKQTRAGSGKRLATAPSTVLVPFELQEAAYNLFVRGQNLDKTFVQTINPEVIPVSYWTDGNDWCTVADPTRAPALEVGFLDGKEDPELFVQDLPNVGSMFSNDQVTYKIRHIYGGSILVDGFKFTTKAVVP